MMVINTIAVNTFTKSRFLFPTLYFVRCIMVFPLLIDVTDKDKQCEQNSNRIFSGYFFKNCFLFPSFVQKNKNLKE